MLSTSSYEQTTAARRMTSRHGDFPSRRFTSETSDSHLQLDHVTVTCPSVGASQTRSRGQFADSQSKKPNVALGVRATHKQLKR